MVPRTGRTENDGSDGFALLRFVDDEFLVVSAVRNLFLQYVIRRNAYPPPSRR